MEQAANPVENPENIVEQSQEPIDTPARVTTEEYNPVHAQADQLVAALKRVHDGDMVAEIIDNAMKLLRDKSSRGDMKLINKSFKELRYALKVFAPYRETRKVSIFGSARTPETAQDYVLAAEFAKQMAAAGWMVITGAGGGIMAAGHGGAGADPSFGLAIRLPFEQKTNPFIEGDPKLINFKYFFTRKLMFVRSSHAVAIFPGGFGTMDEGFEVLTLVQTGKSVPTPIVFVESPGEHFWGAWQDYVNNHLLKNGLISKQDLHLYKITDSIPEAVEEVSKFFRNYHSVRYSRDEIIMRLHHAPDEKQLAEIQSRFKDICISGTFRITSAQPMERDEPTLKDMPRLAFAFNRRDHGKLRMLINYLNELPQVG